MEHQLVIASPTDDELQALLDQWAADGWTLLAHAVRYRKRSEKHWLTFGKPQAAACEHAWSEFHGFCTKCGIWRANA